MSGPWGLCQRGWQCQRLVLASSWCQRLAPFTRPMPVVRCTRSLQVLESSQWYLQEDYGRLLLEQSTRASHYRVEKVARGELDMVAPEPSQFKVVSK